MNKPILPESEVPVVETHKEVEGAPEANATEDLQARIAKFTQDNKPKEEVPEDFAFDSKEIENIQDPVAREYAEKAYKSYQKEFNRKFQEMAELRKSMESSSHKSPFEMDWTPEQVQALTQNPRFLQAAQQVAGQTDYSQSDDDYSALTEREQAAIKKVEMLEKQMSQWQQSQTMQELKKQDEQLAQTYSSYNPQAVDTLTADLIQGKVQADRSSLWKVIDYDDNAKRAYELGRQDERGGVQEKAQSLSMQGQQVVRTPVDMTAEEGQSSKQLWRKIMGQVLSDSNSKAAMKT